MFLVLVLSPSHFKYFKERTYYFFELLLQHFPELHPWAPAYSVANLESDILRNSILQNRSCSVRLDGKWLWTAIFKAGNRFSIGLRCGLWQARSNTWICFVTSEGNGVAEFGAESKCTPHIFKALDECGDESKCTPHIFRALDVCIYVIFFYKNMFAHIIFFGIYVVVNYFLWH